MAALTFLRFVFVGVQISLNRVKSTKQGTEPSSSSIPMAQNTMKIGWTLGTNEVDQEASLQLRVDITIFSALSFERTETFPEPWLVASTRSSVRRCFEAGRGCSIVHVWQFANQSALC